jgi:hypothetical protein
VTAVLAGLACGAFVLAVVLVVVGFRWRSTERRRRDQRERRRIARRLDDDRTRRRLRLRLQPLGPSPAVGRTSPGRPPCRAELEASS